MERDVEKFGATDSTQMECPKTVLVRQLTKNGCFCTLCDYFGHFHPSPSAHAIAGDNFIRGERFVSSAAVQHGIKSSYGDPGTPQYHKKSEKQFQLMFYCTRHRLSSSETPSTIVRGGKWSFCNLEDQESDKSGFSISMKVQEEWTSAVIGYGTIVAPTTVHTVPRSALSLLLLQIPLL